MNKENQTSKSSRDQEAGALWLKKSKAGNDFLSGYILGENKERINVVVFKNTYKKPGESSPDYRVYLSENKSQTTPAQSSPSSESENSADSSDSSDEIPF
jgi:uncharacterized protein (DUF736 family)